MKKGDIFEAETHAEFLNQTFGCHYRSWMKSTWEYNESTTVWMIHIDSAERYSFHNYWDNECIVEHSNKKPTRSCKPIRMVFEIMETNGRRKYIYRGQFRPDYQKIGTNYRRFIPINE